MDVVRRLARGAAIALALAALSTPSSSCFDPKIQNGAIECATDRDCPPGFHCRFPGDNRCWLTLLDAAVPTADGPQPTSDGSQPASDGSQPANDGALTDAPIGPADGAPSDGPIGPNDAGQCGDPVTCESGETCAQCNECCSCNPNGVCAINESCESCPEDCCPAGCDMDGVCEMGEFCTGDCFDCCATLCDFDFLCEPALGESCLTCPNDCGVCPPMDGGIGPGPIDAGGCYGDGGTSTDLCGDGCCNVAGGENCETCELDCGGCACLVPPVCDCQSCPSGCLPGDCP